MSAISFFRFLIELKNKYSVRLKKFQWNNHLIKKTIPWYNVQFCNLTKPCYYLDIWFSVYKNSIVFRMNYDDKKRYTMLLNGKIPKQKFECSFKDSLVLIETELKNRING